MKRIFTLLFLLNNIIYAFGTEPGDITYEVKAGLQVNVVLDSVNLFDLEVARFVNLDFLKRASDRVDLGFGLQLNEVSTTKNQNNVESTGTLVRMPVYFVGKIHLAKVFPINPYLRVLAGYQIILETDEENLNNGSYYGVGVGLELGYFVLDYAYTVEENKGGGEYRGAIGHSLAVGYRF